MSRTKYKIDCIDFLDTTTGKHYGPMDYFEELFNDTNLYTKVIRVKFDTSIEKESINSNNKNYQQIDFQNDLSFIRKFKFWNTYFSLRGTYFILHDSIILRASESFDNCKNESLFDTTDRIRIRCDSLDGVISLHSIMPNNPLIAKLKNKDTLIFRDTFAFEEYSIIDYLFEKHNNK